MLDTIKVKRNATVTLWAFFADSAGAGKTGLTVTLRVLRQSNDEFLVDGDTWSATPDDDYTTADAEVTEVDSTNFPGYYTFAFAVPDADDTYIVRWDGSADAANRYLTDLVIADAATTGMIATYDGTGYTNDHAPATQLQLAGLAGGLAVPTPAESSTVTQGTETNTYAVTATDDGVEYDVTDSGAGIGIDFYMQFDLGGVEKRAVVVHLHAYYEDAGAKTNAIYIQAYNWTTAAWETIETLTDAAAEEVHEPPLNPGHIGETGGDPGLVRIRFLQDTQEGTNVIHINHITVGGVTALQVDSSGYILLSDGSGGGKNSEGLVDDVMDEALTGATHNVTNSLGRRVRELDDLVGYQDGAVWIDTVGGVAGDTPGEHGTVDNPVDNITDALTIAVAKKLVRMRVASGSTVTLLAALEGYEIFNANWSLVLNSQSISGSCISGAAVSGIATGASQPKFLNCDLAAVTLPPCLLHHCGIGNNSGVFTAGSAGQFVFHECYSMVPGSGTPSFVFTGLGSATGINNRAWAGGASWTLDSDCTLSHEVLAGGGTTVVTGGADVEIRGTTRSVTLTLSNAGLVQFAGITGPVTISGTATSIVNLYGIRSTLTDTSIGTDVNDLAADSTRFTAARAQALTDWIDGQRLDVILDATLAAALSCAAVVAAARAARTVTDAYCTQAEIESYFGRDNVRKWADLNNNKVTTEIEARITEAINRATEEIDARLLGGPYTIPLEFATMPRPIVKIAVQLAGDDLYSPRGVQDFDAETGQPLHRLRGEREAALEALRAIRAGVMRFDEDQTQTTPEASDIPTTIDD